MNNGLVLRPFTGRQEYASYHQHELTAYQGNPLIEALPIIISTEEAMEQLAYFPLYNDELRSANHQVRLHSLLDIEPLFQPTIRHVYLYTQISTMLYRGYCGRNPRDTQFWSNIDDGVKKLSLMANAALVFHVSPLSTALIGVSGIGKTRSLERILSLYPQVIHHRIYHNQLFTWTQMVWLKLECPHDGSTKALCKQFIRVVDSILNTNYTEMYDSGGRASQENLIQAMARVASIHSLGLLVIDEIQALNQAKSGGAERMLNFFVQLINSIGIPVILVGTLKARFLFGNEFRQARRATGYTPMVWKPMDETRDWMTFLEAIWEYQYTQEKVPLSKQLAHYIYELCQGITDVAVKLFLGTQCQAIIQGSEKITPDLLKYTASILFPLLDPFLNALRTNDIEQLSRMEDIELVDMTSIVSQAIADSSLHELSPSIPKDSPNQQHTGTRQKSASKSPRKRSANVTTIVKNDGTDNQPTAYEQFQKSNHIGSHQEILDVQPDKERL